MDTQLVSRLWTVAVRLYRVAELARETGRQDWPELAGLADSAADEATDAMARLEQAPRDYYSAPGRIGWGE